MNHPQEACPAADFYCPYCGTKLIDDEVRDLPRPGERNELSCANCGVVTACHPHSILGAKERERLLRLRKQPNSEQLIDALITAKTRLSICDGRMKACHAKHPEEHEVSVEEVPLWLDEMREFIARAKGEL